MDHLRVIFLMAPDGKPIAMLPHEGDAKGIAAELERWVA
jgi:protein SCO1/2